MAIQIPVEAVGKLAKLFARFERKAHKLGVPAPTYKLGAALKVKVDSLHVYDMREVTIVGKAPSLAGWTFMGRIDHRGGAPLIYSAPEQTIPHEYGNSTAFCQHCQQRRRRNDTFILRHQDGRWIEVGSTCLADFLGVSAEQAVAELKLFDEAVRGLGEMSGYEKASFTAPTREVLAMTNAVIRQIGWVSKTEAAADPRKYATAFLVTDLVWQPSKVQGTFQFMKPSEADYAVADKVIAWVSSVNDRNDFMFNLKVVVSGEYVDMRRCGIAAAAIPVYQREQSRIAETRVQGGTSKHIGQIDERMTITGKVIFARPIQTQFGYSDLIKIVTDEGNLVVWFNSGQTVIEPNDVGSRVTLEATVKKHDNYQGVAQTIINRAKLLSKEAR